MTDHKENSAVLDGPQCLEQLGEAQAFSGHPQFWDEAMTARPASRPIYLQREALSARREAAGLAADADATLLAAVEAIEADPVLAQLAWFLHWRVFVAPEHGVPWGPPILEKRLGILAGPFYQLLSLEFPTRLAEVHRQRHYPPEVTAETVLQLLAFDGNYRRGCGCAGIYARQFSWLTNYLLDPYIRLGRLEFQLHTYGGGVNAWQRRSDDAVLALAEDDVRVGPAGLRLAPDAPAEEGWRTSYREESDMVQGYPIDPAGYILPDPVRLSFDEWAPRLRRGDTVIDMHIPAGGGMTWEACIDSLQRASAFFPRYHPDRPFTALALGTWFMDPRLADILPSTANPLHMQRAGYLFPTSPAPDGLWFVFLQSTHNPAILPRDTSMRRALAAFLDTGATWHGGGMFMLREHLDEPVEGRYRAMFAGLLDGMKGT